VCFEPIEGRSAWAPISTQYRNERLAIDAAWRYDGAGQWLTSDQYLNDGATTYTGPDAAFVAAAVGQDRFTATTRPKVRAAGIAAIVAEVRNRGGSML